MLSWWRRVGRFVLCSILPKTLPLNLCGRVVVAVVFKLPNRLHMLNLPTATSSSSAPKRITQFKVGYTHSSRCDASDDKTFSTLQLISLNPFVPKPTPLHFASSLPSNCLKYQVSVSRRLTTHGIGVVFGKVKPSVDVVDQVLVKDLLEISHSFNILFVQDLHFFTLSYVWHAKRLQSGW